MDYETRRESYVSGAESKTYTGLEVKARKADRTVKGKSCGGKVENNKETREGKTDQARCPNNKRLWRDALKKDGRRRRGSWSLSSTRPSNEERGKPAECNRSPRDCHTEHFRSSPVAAHLVSPHCKKYSLFSFQRHTPWPGRGAKTKKEDKACRRRPASGHRTASTAVCTSPMPRHPLLSTRPPFSSPDTSNAHPRLADSCNLRRTQTHTPPKKEASRSCEFPVLDLSSALSSACPW